MKKLIYWGSVLTNLGLLGFVIFATFQYGAPKNDEIGLALLLTASPLLSLALAYFYRNPNAIGAEGWIALELAARKARLKKIISENEGQKAR